MNKQQRKDLLRQRQSDGSFWAKKITSFWLDEYVKNIGDIPVLREAKAFLAYWSNCALDLFPEEWICGCDINYEVAGFQYAGGNYVNDEAVERYVRQENLSGEQEKAFRGKVELVKSGFYHPGNPADFTEAERLSIHSCAASSTWFAGHMIPDYELIMSVGFGGYHKKIAEYRKINTGNDNFYDAMEIMLTAIGIYLERSAAKAEEKAADSRFDRDRCLRIAGNFRNCVENPPVHFWEALQLSFTVHLLWGCDSFGRFDQYLQKQFSYDIDNGFLTLEEAYDLLCEYMVKIEQVNAIQNMTIGGCDGSGRGQYTALTRLILEATRNMRYKGPNLCLRVTADMPQEMWTLAMDCLATGQGLPALYNDSVYIESLVRAGYDIETARGYALAGCSQLMIGGRCNFINDIGMMNAAKILELTLYNGYDPRINAQVGLRTGEVSDFASFEEFYAAFETQCRYFCKAEADIHNKDAVLRGMHYGYAMRSLFTRGCIENAKPVFCGGAEFNNIELEIIGITNAADSIYAVKKAVFDEKKISFPQLLDILKNNYEGNEPLRKYLSESIPKFGNDEKELDTIRAEITALFYRCLNAEKAVFGGIFVPGEVIFVAHEWQGNVVGATPDGRLSGTVLADSIGACQGKDKAGPTALFQSVLRIPQSEYLLTTPVLNVRFLKSAWTDPVFNRAVESLFKIYFEQKGMQLQINVCDAEILKKAQQNPDQYRNLVVRVGGYSDYFVNISPALQNELILRTEYSRM